MRGIRKAELALRITRFLSAAKADFWLGAVDDPRDVGAVLVEYDRGQRETQYREPIGNGQAGRVGPAVKNACEQRQNRKGR